jgi:pimeloyl-[acyl-carrier protein] methyl ester esterase
MIKPKLVILHGWAVHSAIWDTVEEDLSNHFELYPIDLPGYGNRQPENGDFDLDQLASDVLSQAPEVAHWMGWSLGSMVAMSAALRQPSRINSLKLVSPTPLFVQAQGWDHGITLPALENLQTRFHTDYDTALKRFLLMQAGTDQVARGNAKATWQRLTQSPTPTRATLDAGLDILKTTDLRNRVQGICVPTRIITCREDRVIPAAAGQALHQMISQSTLLELPSGHAPMIEIPSQFVQAITAV